MTGDPKLKSNPISTRMNQFRPIPIISFVDRRNAFGISARSSLQLQPRPTAHPPALPENHQASSNRDALPHFCVSDQNQRDIPQQIRVQSKLPFYPKPTPH
jgi:hypothetical protein